MKTTTVLRRHTKHGRLGKPMNLKADHNAIVGATTLFTKRVRKPDFADNLFKSGVNSPKIGSRVMKGSWQGMPIYTLTLEERATCYTGCEHWHDCYGNHMHWPTRWEAGPQLERMIPGQLAAMARKHPDGFVLRLHVLGDFYSRRYIRIWMDAMVDHPMMRIYGYTRWPKTSPQGKAIEDMNRLFPQRSKIRWSEHGGEMGTVTLTDTTLRGRVPEGIVCPAQTEDSECCATCALCWGSAEPIVFLNH